jgi:integrin beta 1
VQHNATQIRPQRLQIDLRLRQPIQFELKFRQVIDYPLDLYYLMDLSYTMKDDKAKLAALGDTLAGKMRQITRNFRLGFGSFVDKTTLPFIRTSQVECVIENKDSNDDLTRTDD